MREQRPGLTELHPSRMIVEGPRWRSVAFSADGQRFFAANAASNAVYVFPRPFTQCVASFGAHEGVESLAAAPDGRFAATGSPRDRHVRIWDVSSGQDVHATAAGRASGLAFSPDNRWLLIHRDTLDLREIGTWQPSPPLPFAGGQMITGAGCFSRDGRLLAIVVNQIEVHLFDLKSWKTIGRLRGQIETPMNGLAFSPDGRHLCAASARGRLRIWDLAEIRNRLAESDLDWDLPPLDFLPAPDSAPLELIRVPAPTAE
jgi:COMPASS component SWD3